MSRRRALALVLLLAAGPAAAGPDPAAEAFAAGDFARAETLWREAADAGSSDAMLGLGRLFDYGIGRPADRVAAYRWYLMAALRGVPEAQFNVGVMSDAGIGTGRDPDRAFLWYSRAALGGNARARYNLGLLFEAGAGTAPQPDLARFWFRAAAADLPAAAAKLAALPGAATAAGTRAPEPVFAAFGIHAAELVWRAAAQGAGGPFAAQVAYDADDGSGPHVASARTEGSGLAIPLPAGAVPLFWRVSALGGGAGGYAASDWQGLPAGAAGPRGVARISAGDAVPPALGRELRGIGLWALAVDGSGTGAAAPPPAAVRVRYGYAGDAGLAEAVTGLPSLRGTGPATLDASLGLMPGEVDIDLGARRVTGLAAD